MNEASTPLLPSEKIRLDPDVPPSKQQNPCRWSSIENLASDFYVTWIRIAASDKMTEDAGDCVANALRPFTDRSFDIYEKMDGTNVGITVWPPDELGELVGRNYVPKKEQMYQQTSLGVSLRREETYQYGRIFAEELMRLFLPSVHSSNVIDFGVKKVLLYGEMIIRGRSTVFGYDKRNVNPGDYFVFDAMVVCQDQKAATTCSSVLRTRHGFATKMKHLQNSDSTESPNSTDSIESPDSTGPVAVQVSLNGAFEDWMRATVPPYFKIPRCFARDVTFADTMRDFGRRLIDESEMMEGVVITRSAKDVKDSRGGCDIIYKWKTGLTDDSANEMKLHKELSRISSNGQYESRDLSDTGRRFAIACMRTFLNVYQNPAVKRHREKNNRLERHKEKTDTPVVDRW